MEPAFYLSTWGRRRGGSVDEAPLSSRQDHHHRDHRAGPPVVCPGPVPRPLRGGWTCTSRLGVEVGPGPGSTHAPKIAERRDEGELDIRLAGGRAPSASSQNLSALVPFGNRCYERQKEGFCPKPPPEEGGMTGGAHKVLAGALLRPCTPSCHIWHATHVVPHTQPMPSHALLQAASEGSVPGFLREISSDAKTSQTWVILHHPETASCRERPRKPKEGGDRPGKGSITTQHDRQARSRATQLQTRKDTLCACSVLTRGAMLWGTNPVLGAQCSDTFQKVTLCLISRP